jgi:hypothetical protein
MAFTLPTDTSKLSLLPPVFMESATQPGKFWILPWWIELDKTDPEGHKKAANEFYDNFRNDVRIRFNNKNKTGSSKTWKVKEYTVTLNVDGKYSCTCKGFAFRRECKHVKSIQTGVSIETFDQKPKQKKVATVTNKSKNKATVLVNPVDGKTYTVGQRGRRPEWASNQMKKLGLA